MPRPRATESRTRARLVQAALGVFARRGYHGATVDDIVAASDSSKGAFYHYFPNKQGIFLGLINMLAGLVEARVEASIKDEQGALRKIDAALRVVFAVATENRDLARVLLVEAPALGPEFEQGRLGVHRRFTAVIRRHLDRAVAEGAIPAQDTGAAASAWVGAINEIITQRLAADGDLAADLPDLRVLLLRSIGAQAHHGRP